MKKPELPKNEEQRLAKLREFQILDTKEESSFDDITQIASQICETKISLVSLVDSDRQWFKAKTGLDASETPRDISWCGHAILGDDIFEIPDSLDDIRFKDNPLATTGPVVRFYAGAPLVTTDGYKIGTLCVIDSAPKQLSDWQKDVLRKLAKQVVRLMENRISEFKLKEANQILEFTLEGAALGKWDWNLSTNAVHFDKRWCEMIGLDYESTEMMFSTWKDRVHPEDIGPALQKVKDHLEGKSEHYENTHRLKHSNGSWVWIVARGKISQYDGKNMPLRFSGTHFNITNIKQAEELLLDVQRLAKVGGWKLNLGETMEFEWTEETYNIYGLPVHSKIDMEKSIHAYAENDRQRIQGCVNKAISDGTPWDEEFEFCDYKGNKKWVRAIGEAIKSVESKVVTLRGTFQDITLIKNLSLNLDEQRKVSQHQAKLASIGQLAAGVGHEINNPLAIIKGFLSILEANVKSDDSDKARSLQVLSKINIACERIVKIVNSLRVFSRSGVDQVITFNLSESIVETCVLLEELFSRDHVSLKYSINPRGPVFMKGNRGRIEQALVNILANAKDASEGKDVRKIALEFDSNETHATIKISDNGRGIPNEIKDKVFDAFFTTKEVSKGTGIGLSIVSSIIKEHDGHIHFNSSTDKGTEFFMEFPIVNDKAVQQNCAVDQDGLLKAKRLNILVVDDEEDIRFLIEQMLKNVGFNLLSVPNGEVALMELEKIKYDLVITDLKMPKMDGLALIKEIRSKKSISQPRIIIMTGGTNIDEKKMDKSKLQYDSLLLKPFVFKDLINHIDLLFPKSN